MARIIAKCGGIF